MKRSLVLLVVAAQFGCGAGSRFKDVSREPAPRFEIRSERPIPARPLCSATFSHPELEKPASDDFLSTRAERFARALEEANAFTGAPGDMPLRLRIEERVTQVGHAPWPHCFTGHASALLLGFGFLLIPVWVAQSYEYRECEPDLEVSYSLVVSTLDGAPMAVYETAATVHVEEQQMAFDYDRLAGVRQRGALDAAFERSSRVLVAKLVTGLRVR